MSAVVHIRHIGVTCGLRGIPSESPGSFWGKTCPHGHRARSPLPGQVISTLCPTHTLLPGQVISPMCVVRLQASSYFEMHQWVCALRNSIEEPVPSDILHPLSHLTSSDPPPF